MPRKRSTPKHAPDIRRRKADHLALCASGQVDFRETITLLDQVTLIHQSLPELHFDEVDLSIDLLGKRLRAPILIAGMTGGTPAAAAINRDLARAAQSLGLGFGLGSQRAMLLHPDLAWTYQVRDIAPDILLLGNLGMVQARDLSTSAVRELLDTVGADALCIHLNPAMELIQPGGDRDFRAGRDTLKRLSHQLGLPVIAKETGCGFSRTAAELAKEAGVAAIDISGAGGTSWVGVETLRSRGAARRLGELFWDWGIPTAASLALLSDFGLPLIATGGLRSGLDIAKALALGATAAGLAAPLLRAHRAGGYDAVLQFLQEVIEALRIATFLTGQRTPQGLRSAEKILGPRLRPWLASRRQPETPSNSPPSWRDCGEES